ncbi:hypothetical protein GCM10025762_15160 [Haloechinothrix salitolerans]
MVLSTVPSADAVNAVMGGLGRRGRFILVGAATDPVYIVPALMIAPYQSIAGHASGTAKDSEDTMAFSVLNGVRPMIEIRPLAEAAAAYDRMMAGDARFRMVLQVPG